jgi:hypothetical protein
MRGSVFADGAEEMLSGFGGRSEGGLVQRVTFAMSIDAESICPLLMAEMGGG